MNLRIGCTNSKALLEVNHYTSKVSRTLLKKASNPYLPSLNAHYNCTGVIFLCVSEVGCVILKHVTVICTCSEYQFSMYVIYNYYPNKVSVV